MALVDAFPGAVDRLLAQSQMQRDRVLSPATVFQEPHTANRDLFFTYVSPFLEHGSGIDGLDNIARLAEISGQGHSCLILAEHVSNLDVPTLWMLMKLAGTEYASIFERIVFVAGRKLNEESGIVKIFAEMFARIVISPKTSYEGLPDGDEKDRLLAEAHAINMAAHRKIRELKSQGRIFLVYPSGTRYRPWEPWTARGLRETEGYLRLFEYFLPASCEGNLMPPERGVSMEDETPRPERVRISFGAVEQSEVFRRRVLAEKHDQTDEKQYVIDCVMEQIAALHRR